MADTDNAAPGGVFATEVPGTLSGSYEFIGNAVNTLEGDIADAKEAAQTAETNAAASATAAANSATAAANSATTAASEASDAADSAADALIQRGYAEGHATNAAASETAAELAETNTEALYDDFDTKYLGTKASAPTVDNNGDTLLEGALYYDSTDNVLKSWDGSAWQEPFTDAATAKTDAESAQTAAEAAQAAAETAQTAAELAETNAATSESNAADSEDAAALSESNALTYKNSAETAKTAAEAALASTQSVFDAFDDTYLGSKASDPTVDNDGDPLNEGDIYWNSTDNVLKFYDGSNWVSPETLADNSATAAAASAAAALVSENAAAASESAAAASESAASLSETNASTSESAAAASESAAALSESAAAASESAAATSEGNAATSATNAQNSASAANTSAIAAASSQSSAAASATSAANSYDAFDDRYLGDKASDPTTDNDGDALATGALYYNTTDGVMKVYNGSAWVAAYASLSGTLVASNNLSDVASVSASRTNLGLEIGTDVLAYDANVVSDSSYVHTDNNYTTTEKNKLAGIEALADVTDTTNVVAALTAGTAINIAGDGTISYTGSTDLVGDTTPQLGGNLDLNSSDITGTGNIDITGTLDVSGEVNFADSVTVEGDFTVNGTTTTINATNLAVSDNMIYLRDGESTGNVDLGVVGNYNDGTYAHAGLFRDATDGRFKVFDGYTPEPDAAVDINTAHASFSLADFQASTFIGDVTGNVTGNVTGSSGSTTGNAATATKLANARTIGLSGDVSGSVSFDGSANATITATVADDSHNHTIANVDGLQTALDAKVAKSGDTMTGNLTIGSGNDLFFKYGTNDANTSLSIIGDGTDPTISFKTGDSQIYDDGTNGNGLKINGRLGVSIGKQFNSIMFRGEPDAEVKLYYNNVEKLRTISTGIDVAGNIALSGTVDGRNVASDGAKLDGIESGATADQTASEILTAIKTVDGAGSGLDADLLDGQNSSYYLNTSTTFGGDVSGSYNSIVVANNSHTHNGSTIDDNSISAAELNVSGNGSTSQFLRSDGDGSFTWATPTDTNTTYSAGSGLDLSGTTFSIEPDLRDGITHIGLDLSDFIYFTNNSRIDFYINGSNEFRFESDGDLHADGDVIAYSTTTSDPRLKDNIQKVENALEMVEKLNGYTFTYKVDGRESAGVMSTEVREVLPSAVTEKTLPLKSPFGPDDKTEYDVVQYDQLHAVLIEAIKELKSEVDELKNKLGE